MSLIDISFFLDKDTVIYPNNPGFELNRLQSVEKGDNSTISLISMGSHTGTHIDAPAHFVRGGATIDMIPLDRFSGRAKVIDATGMDTISADFVRGLSIQPEDILIFKTDNSYNWSCDRILDKYVTLTYDAATVLSTSDIKLVGIDYLTIECPRGFRIQGKSVHRSLLGNGILICEALDLQHVIPGEYMFYCFPLKIRGVDGCPVRACLCSL